MAGPRRAARAGRARRRPLGPRSPVERQQHGVHGALGHDSHEETLQATVSSLLGYVPEQFKPDPDKSQEPWTIHFARQQPISVSFVDDGFRLTIRGQQYFKGEKAYPAMNITATYKFVKDGASSRRFAGRLEMFPPDFVPGSGSN